MASEKNSVIPVSVMLVSYNFGYMLERCIKNLPENIGELVVVNLQSPDNTKEIAENLGAKVITVPRLRQVEMVHNKLKDEMKYDWILTLDPDEVMSPALKANFGKMVSQLPDNVGIVRLRWLFHFKEKRLKGTPWGGENNKPSLINRKKVVFTDDAHRGKKIKDGFEEILHNHPDEYLNHYWMDSYGALFEKHLRYLEDEGKSRYNNGIRTHFAEVLSAPFTKFRYAFNYRLGRKDGLAGLFLSLLYTWYETTATFKLWRYQKKQERLGQK